MVFSDSSFTADAPTGPEANRSGCTARTNRRIASFSGGGVARDAAVSFRSSGDAGSADARSVAGSPRGRAGFTRTPRFTLDA